MQGGIDSAIASGNIRYTKNVGTGNFFQVMVSEVRVGDKTLTTAPLPRKAILDSGTNNVLLVRCESVLVERSPLDCQRLLLPFHTASQGVPSVLRCAPQ